MSSSYVLIFQINHNNVLNDFGEDNCHFKEKTFSFFSFLYLGASIKAVHLSGGCFDVFSVALKKCKFGSSLRLPC